MSTLRTATAVNDVGASGTPHVSALLAALATLVQRGLIVLTR